MRVAVLVWDILRVRCIFGTGVVVTRVLGFHSGLSGLSDLVTVALTE